MTSNEDVVRQFLEGSVSIEEMAKKALRKEDTNIYSLDKIREKMAQGLVAGLEPEELIIALISDEDITVDQVLSAARKANGSSSQEAYQQLFADLDAIDQIGEARAGRIIASVEIARRHCL